MDVLQKGIDFLSLGKGSDWVSGLPEELGEEDASVKAEAEAVEKEKRRPEALDNEATYFTKKQYEIENLKNMSEECKARFQHVADDIQKCTRDLNEEPDTAKGKHYTKTLLKIIKKSLVPNDTGELTWNPHIQRLLIFPYCAEKIVPWIDLPPINIKYLPSINIKYESPIDFVNDPIICTDLVDEMKNIFNIPIKPVCTGPDGTASCSQAGSRGRMPVNNLTLQELLSAQIGGSPREDECDKVKFRQRQGALAYPFSCPRYKSESNVEKFDNFLLSMANAKELTIADKDTAEGNVPIKKHQFIITHSSFLTEFLVHINKTVLNEDGTLKYRSVKKSKAIKFDNFDILQLTYIREAATACNWKFGYYQIRRYRNNYEPVKFSSDPNFLLNVEPNNSNPENCKHYFLMRHCMACHNLSKGGHIKTWQAIRRNRHTLWRSICLLYNVEYFEQKAKCLKAILEDQCGTNWMKTIQFGSSVIFRAILTSIIVSYLLTTSKPNKITCTEIGTDFGPGSCAKSRREGASLRERWFPRRRVEDFGRLPPRAEEDADAEDEEEAEAEAAAEEAEAEEEEAEAAAEKGGEGGGQKRKSRKRKSRKRKSRKRKSKRKSRKMKKSRKRKPRKRKSRKRKLRKFRTTHKN